MAPIGAARAARVSVLDAIPDSVVYQYRAEDFASPWPDQVGTADMTVNGMVASTFTNGETSVFGDGTDDYGLADGPETLPVNETFGLAFTTQFPTVGSFSTFFASISSDGTGMQVRSGVQTAGGDIELSLNDGTNPVRVYTTNTYDDNTPHAVVINKNGNPGSDIDIYVDDMSTPASTTNPTDQGFSHTAYSTTSDLGFYARNNDGTIDGYMEMDAGVFEFATEPYSQSERDGFVSRRPEV